MISDIKDFLEEYWIFILIPVLIVGFLIYLFYPRDYILDVRQIQWEYVVHIEEFMVQHHSGDRSKPSDAYNVESHYHPKTKTWTDEDGKTHTEDDSYWTYDYDVNRWSETRQVMTTDFDHEPFFGEYTLKTSDREDGIGAERAIEEKIYRAIGLTIGQDEGLTEVIIPETMWDILTTDDQINYQKSEIGKPKNPSIAK